MSDQKGIRTIVVVPYDPTWPKLFEKEASILTPVFGSNLLALHHIGSTSVPGLAAKPTLDLMAEIADLNLAPEAVKALEALGYEARGAFGIEGRAFFVKGAPDPTHHLHVFQSGHPEILRHLAFREYLTVRPTLAAQYTKLKSDLAKAHRHNIAGYQSGKSAWICRVEQEALEWQRVRDHHRPPKQKGLFVNSWGGDSLNPCSFNV